LAAEGAKLARLAELLLGGGPVAAELSKNNNCGWDFLERLGKLQ
jgi:hypothetical protein